MTCRRTIRECKIVALQDAAAQLRAVLAVATAAMAVAFIVHVTARLSEILTILEGMK